MTPYVTALAGYFTHNNRSIEKQYNIKLKECDQEITVLAKPQYIDSFSVFNVLGVLSCGIAIAVELKGSKLESTDNYKLMSALIAYSLGGKISDSFSCSDGEYELTITSRFINHRDLKQNFVYFFIIQLLLLN